MRPLIVGEAPGRRTGAPLAGRCGAVLAEYCGLDQHQFERCFARINLLMDWPGGAGKGAAFDLQAARSAAHRLQRRWRRRLVVLLGKRVAVAFGLQPAYFEPQRLGAATVFVVPHPSGINRWHNDYENRRIMASFMQRLTQNEVSRSGR